MFVLSISNSNTISEPTVELSPLQLKHPRKIQLSEIWELNKWSVGWSHSYKMAHRWAYAKWSDKQLPIHSYEPLLSENQVLKTLHFSIWFFFFFLTSVWFPTELVEMGKTQESQDKVDAGRCLKRLIVINSQHTQEWLKTKPKPTSQCYPKDAQA